MSLPMQAFSQLPVRALPSHGGTSILMSFPLQSLPSIGSDLWPSLSGLANPLKTLRRYRAARSRTSDGAATQSNNIRYESRVRQNSPFLSNEETEVVKIKQPLALPECLSQAPLHTLRLSSDTHATLLYSSPLTSNMALFRPTHMARPLSILKRSLSTTSSAARASVPSPSNIPRVQYAQRSIPSSGFGPPRRGGFNLGQQKRMFSSTFQPANQNALAHAERTANNNPTSATAQQAFYSALLRANMPKIVIERYQAGRYASNTAAESSYLKALQMTGSVPSPGSAGSNQTATNNLSPDTLQAVGQAVAGQNRGGSVIKPGSKAGTGAKDTPLYVVIEESWGATVLKWVKTLLWVGIAGYFLLVVLTMVVELTGSFRTRAGQNNEVQPQHQTVRFSDVHGVDEAKDELQELVEFLMNPEKFNKLGGKLPKGVLLVGPPGTGKTMLARAVAGEAGCPFFYMSGSEFDELYVGVGAKRVRDLFAQARNKAPSIIFIDELDAVGGKRNARDPAYAKQTLNQLLTELDGFSPSTGVILIAATNYPEALDKALTRPGRFDRHVNVPLPDVRGRIEILKHHMRNMPVAADVDATNLARATSGMSGADLENVANQAAVHASRMKYKKVSWQDFEWAKDKVMMGAENKSRMIREKDKIMTAYHEAGHALVNIYTPGSNQLYKVTIVPRGMALGVTHSLPEMDAVSMGYDQYLAGIDVSMGGRAAEELIYGPNKVTTGISHDVQSATRYAYDLITRCGFSPKLGNVDLASDYNNLSSETKQEVEREVRAVVEAGRERADKIILEKRKELEALKDALMEYETLDKEEVLKVIRGEKLKRIPPEPMGTEEVKKDDEDGGDRRKKANQNKPKETGPKGGLGIKLPDVLLPAGAGGGRGGSKENARSDDR